MSLYFFISYSHLDKNKMEALRKAIQKANGKFVPIVVAKTSMPNKSLSQKVQNAILNSSFIIPILTKNSLTNAWVNQEIGFATAYSKNILPIVDKNVIPELKGFIHDQIDLPFHFESDDSNHAKEAKNYRQSYKTLIRYLQNTLVEVFKTSIKPKKIPQGSNYKTTVTFKGYLENGFFDNLNEHLNSTFRDWCWDVNNLKSSDSKKGGELHGQINIKSTYECSTKKWPKGKYKVSVRVYDHPIDGKPGRYYVDEEVHQIEII